MSMTTDKPPADDPAWADGSYWHSKRTMAAGLVLVLLVVMIAWTITSSEDDKPAAKPASAAYESACGLTGGTTQIPDAAPPTDWQIAGSTWLPISTVHGPGKRSSNGAWSCFSRTPSGAVMAGWTIPFRIATATDVAAVVRQQTAAGAGQGALLKQAQQPQTPAPATTPLGYKFIGYTDEAATINYHIQQRDKNYECTTRVQWSGGPNGDWLLRLTPEGDLYSGCDQRWFSSGSGFVPWGPKS